jgi:ubiquinone/menaquinone biosynthesis C-methylase UbiE
MATARQLAESHWNETPLYISAEERYRTYPWLYRAAEFNEHKGHQVLEIGCGTGCDLFQFAKHGATATGIDVTDRHLDLARNRIGNLAKVMKADARELPFAGESFDYVYSHGVIHHCDAPHLIAREILRVLRPEGRFNIHVYAKWSYTHFRGLQKFGREWSLHIENSTAPVYIDLYTGRKLRQLFPGIQLTIRKYEFSHCQYFGRWVGWFLVATGKRPG